MRDNDTSFVIKLMPLSFFKAGGIYTGNVNAMRFMVKKETSGDDQEVITVYIWPGPFAFDETKDVLKEHNSFALSEECLNEAAVWMENKYRGSEEKFSAPVSLLDSDHKLKDDMNL